MTTYYAPSIKSLSHNKIRLECDPELVRAIWKAKGLAELKGVCPESVEIIERQRFPDLASAKMETLSSVAGFHGVKFAGFHKNKCCNVFYLDAVDPFAPMLVFAGNHMTVDCWYDLMGKEALDTNIIP